VLSAHLLHTSPRQPTRKMAKLAIGHCGAADAGSAMLKFSGSICARPFLNRRHFHVSDHVRPLPVYGRDIARKAVIYRC